MFESRIQNQTDPMIVTNEIVYSGTFIEMYKSGALSLVSPWVAHHRKIGQRLAIVEAKLRACHDPVFAFEYQEYCDRCHKNFAQKLPILAAKLEGQKQELLDKLRKNEERIAKVNPLLAEWFRSFKYPPPQEPVSLVP